jgi:predicted nucleotidyltransferase
MTTGVYTMAKQRRIPEAMRAELDKIVKQVDRFSREDHPFWLPMGSWRDSDLDLLIIKKTAERFIDRWTNVRKIVSDPERSIPFEPLILTPRELEERLARGDQFMEEIMTKGVVLYAA